MKPWVWAWLSCLVALGLCVQRYGWVNVAFAFGLYVLAMFVIVGVVDAVLDRRHR